MTAPRDAVAHFHVERGPEGTMAGTVAVGGGAGAWQTGRACRGQASRGSDDANRAPGPDPHRWRGRKALDSLRADIGGAKGSAILVESTTGGWDEGRQQAGTRHDWRAERLGPQ